MNATPLISSTRASAFVWRLIKFAVIAMASLPLNSFLLNPSSVFLFPSAPMRTSNSYWLTGWSAGLTSALQPIFSRDCSSGGGSKRSKLTPSWISTPKMRATFRRIHWSCLILIWSMEPAQNFPKNFLAPSALRSWITNGHRWSTLLREIRSRFSTITTFAPNNCASIAVRRPQGPAPIIRTRVLGQALPLL